LSCLSSSGWPTATTMLPGLILRPTTDGLALISSLPRRTSTSASPCTYQMRGSFGSWSRNRVLTQLNDPFAGGLIASQPPSISLTTSTTSPWRRRLVGYIFGSSLAPLRTWPSGTLTVASYRAGWPGASAFSASATRSAASVSADGMAVFLRPARGGSSGRTSGP
jgi:hypothetical protein